MSGNSSRLCTVLTALTYWARLSLVLTRPVETSHIAKKHKTQGSMGRKRMLASMQNSTKAFHSEEMALSVLGAQACCCTNFIFLASPSRKTKNKMLKIKHFRFRMPLYWVDSDTPNEVCNPFLGFLIGWSGIGVCQPIVFGRQPGWFHAIVMFDL